LIVLDGFGLTLSAFVAPLGADLFVKSPVAVKDALA